jgi:transposase InsO family protein
MAEAFVKTFKRDYVRVSPIPDAATALALVDSSMEDYNTMHPHSRLGYRAHLGSTSCPNPSRVRFNGVNSTSPDVPRRWANYFRGIDQPFARGLMLNIVK